MSAVSTTPSPGAYAFKPGRLSSHGRILAFLRSLPRDVRILDVGAAAGYLGAALRDEGFTRVSGVEGNPVYAQQARPFYDRLDVEDVEHGALSWAPASFDVIICADILEHVREPSIVLQRLRGYLASGGWLVASVPNIAHWSVRMHLLLGHFDYRPSGLLDRTHLRFFTRASARALLRDAGLTIAWEAATPLPIAHWCNGSSFTPLWRVAERIDWALARMRPGLFAYQFVLGAHATA